jgi:hypothetical protein
MNYIADAIAILNVASQAIAVAADAAPFVEQAIGVLQSKTALSADARAALMANEAALVAQLNADSIPADEP